VLAQIIVGRLIGSRQCAQPSGLPSMSLGARRLRSVKRQFLAPASAAADALQWGSAVSRAAWYSL